MRLTESEIIAQSWLFFLAGYETTKTTIGFISYFLAMNQDCQEKLYLEIKHAFEQQKISNTNLGAKDNHVEAGVKKNH
jgi:cytochrome P450